MGGHSGQRQAFRVELCVSKTHNRRTTPPQAAMTRLAKHGLHVEPEVMRSLSVAPSQHTPVWSWYNLSLKEQGRRYDPWVPEGCEAMGYLHGKFRKNRSAAAGPWSTVV